MEFRICGEDERKVAVLDSEGLVIKDVQSALDFMSLLFYEYGCSKAVILKSNLPEAFFDLKTRLAGEILQKFTNYRFRLAVVGDFSRYTGKSLKDFIYESNKAKQILFVSSEREALELLKD
jgi:hypothetical protein